MKINIGNLPTVKGPISGFIVGLALCPIVLIFSIFIAIMGIVLGVGLCACFIIVGIVVFLVGLVFPFIGLFKPSQLKKCLVTVEKEPGNNDKKI